MLIELIIKNFRSFRDEQRFSLVAATSDKSLPGNTFQSKGFKQTLLHSAVIYGPNASGKSNLILALQALHLLLAPSLEGLPSLIRRHIYKPFLLEPETQQAPTSIEVHFLQGDVRYQYGLVFDREFIHEEWLIAYPKGQAQTWFTRRRCEDADPKDPYEWYFGARLLGEKQRLVALTRDDVPFLTIGARFNNAQLLHVYEWFQNHLMTVVHPDLIDLTAQRVLEQATIRDSIRSLLRAADFGITDFRVQETRMKDDPDFASLPEPLRLLANNVEMKRIDTLLIHAAPKLPNGQVEFEQRDESLGTLRFFGIAGPIVDALLNGNILVIDELDASLHPVLVRHIIELFHNTETNPHHAQLIFNTHDATLLDTELFRRDQIWFTEKDADGASTLLPLSDYKPRKDEALMQRYLHGSYGAVPFIDTTQLTGELLEKGTRHA
jgi:AAA15 family ATPase/GTPase